MISEEIRHNWFGFFSSKKLISFLQLKSQIMYVWKFEPEIELLYGFCWCVLQAYYEPLWSTFVEWYVITWTLWQILHWTSFARSIHLKDMYIQTLQILQIVRWSLSFFPCKSTSNLLSKLNRGHTLLNQGENWRISKLKLETTKWSESSRKNTFTQTAFPRIGKWSLLSTVYTYIKTVSSKLLLSALLNWF